MKKIFAFILITASLTAAGQKKSPSPAIKRVDPTNWWIGMKNPDIQLLVYGTGIVDHVWTIDYPGVKLVKVTKPENPNYIFLDISISPSAQPGTFQIVGTLSKKVLKVPYELKARTPEPKGTGINSTDLIYLIMPDRFANGDPSNDKFKTMRDTAANRKSPFLRHGGDFKGIEAHLDYIQQLGATAVWLTPVLDNDEKLKLEGHGKLQAGYHGYHFTDHYKIDRRFGGNDGYISFSKAVHAKGMKLIQDAVYNHVSDDHWLFVDPPSKDWFNNWPAYTGSSHKEQVMYDPYSSAADRKVLIDGWFTPFLPDLNLKNEFLAKYLIQNAIWSTEMFSLDAWRIDTYKYNDQTFMNRCNDALLSEYPNIHLFGETVTGNPLALSYFVKSNVGFPVKSTLPGSLDFPLNYAMLDALNQKFGWDEGVNRIHQTLAQDIVYADPMKMVTSLDNHDMDRFLSVIREDFASYKIGITWLLTLRGIPSLYYGTEILMKNYKSPTDAEVRQDFPGGFAGDEMNKFTVAGRNDKENEAFAFVSKLAAYRHQTGALNSGKLMQFVPERGVYVYFRYDSEKTIMVVTNSNEREATFEPARFTERLGGVNAGTEVISGKKIPSINGMKIPGKTALVIDLNR